MPIYKICTTNLTKKYLQNITNTINLNVDFEINQIVQEENELPDGNVTKRRRKSCSEERKQNIYIKRRSLGQSYLGKKLWTDVERPERKMGELCVKPTCKNKDKSHC